jgi:hypothetical protein
MFYIIRDQPFKSFDGGLFLWNILFSCQAENKYRISVYFRGSKICENVLKWDAFIYATQFREMAIYMILFEREIIIRGLLFSRIYHSREESEN